MDPSHLPLLIAYSKFLGTQESEPLDDLRMQKGVFLLTMRGNPEWRNTYSFVAYDWGPFSYDLAYEIKRLIGIGLLKLEPFPGRKYMQYVTTPRGDRVVADDILPHVSNEDIMFIRNIRQYINSRSFAQLLREIYKAYPEYAINSRFAG
jgi:uncharacterized protein YwgA